jgi:hypothetical protein
VTGIAVINTIRIKWQGFVSRHEERMRFDRFASYDGNFGLLPDTPADARAHEEAHEEAEEAEEAAVEPKRRAKQSDA